MNDDIARWEDDGGYTCPPPPPRRQAPTYWFDETPARSTLDRLRQLPSLVHQVMLTLDAPNPRDEAGRTSRPRPGSKPPTSLHALDLLRATDHRDEEYSHAPLIRLAQCSRIVMEAIDDETKAAHPQPLEGLSWRTECAWLAGVWPAAQAWLDLVDFDWIETEVRTIHGMFAAAARLPKPARYACPKCSGEMQPAHGGRWLACTQCPHEERGDIEQRYRRRPPATIAKLSDEFTVPEATIRSWRRRGKLKPARVEGGRPLFWPWDVLLLSKPAIARAIEERERVGA